MLPALDFQFRSERHHNEHAMQTACSVADAPALNPTGCLLVDCRMRASKCLRQLLRRRIFLLCVQLRLRSALLMQPVLLIISATAQSRHCLAMPDDGTCLYQTLALQVC